MKGHSIFNGPVKSDGKPWFSVRNKEDISKPVEILIYDQIGKDWFGEGTGAEDFAKELKAIAPERDILVRINSPGGNVYDGLAIYHQLLARQRVITQNDGLAASISGVILLAGKEVRMARASSFMYHDPETIAIGNEAALQMGITRLKAAKASIISVYARKTGKPESEIAHDMSKETWLTGEAAKEYGFVDVITDDAPVMNSFDLSRFRCVPEVLRKMHNHSAHSESGAKPNQIMNREQIIALLKEHGIEVPEKATDTELEALLKQTLAKAKSKPPEKKEEQPAATVEDKTSADLTATTKRLEVMEAKYENERKKGIEKEIDNAIEERRIVASQRANWIARALKDETVLTDIKAMPQNLPGDSAVSVECTSESITDISAHAKRLKSENSPDARIAFASFVRKHAARFAQVWNAGTNTIDAALKQDLLLDASLRAFAKILASLSAFSTKFENVPLLGTDKVVVPFFDLATAASTDWVAANGYVGGDTSTGKREVTVNKRKYQAIQFTSQELRRQPYLMLEKHYGLVGEKLAYDIFNDILSVVTVANYPDAGFAGPVGSFFSDSVADLQLAGNNAQWPEPGRSMFLNSTFDNQLKKDSALKSALNAGGSEVIRQGKVPNIYGFDYMWNANLPTNSESLAGFIAFKSAILIATAPIPPTEEVVRDGTQYTQVTDPDLGITLEQRTFGESQMDRGFRVIEANYGYNVGNAAALIRITSA